MRHAARVTGRYALGRAGNEAALALYCSEGYVVEGVERDQIRDVDGFEDNVVMARFLDPGEGADGDLDVDRGADRDADADLGR